MPRQEIEVKKQSELLPKSTGGLFSFDEFDNFFDDFMTRKWPRLMDWNVPTLSQANFPRVDIIDHENDIEVKATLPGVKKEDIDVSIINQTITIRTSCKEEKKEEEKDFSPKRRTLQENMVIKPLTSKGTNHRY